MHDYKNTEDVDYLVDNKQLIKEEISALFGLYPHSKAYSAVIQFTNRIIPDLKYDEIVKFCNHWANSGKKESPSHLDIKKYVDQMRLRSDDIKEFEPSDACLFNMCNGGGFVVGIKDGYRFLFKCQCNTKSELPLISDQDKFDDIKGLPYGD